jgi:hypothetical protein
MLQWLRILAFLAALTASAVAQPPPSNSAADEARIEALMWQDAVRADRVSAFEEYLRQYPEGRFRGEAEQNIARLGAPSARAGADPVQQLIGEWRADAGSACTSSPWRFRVEGGDLVWERTIRGAWEEYVRRPAIVLNGNHIEFTPRQGNAFELVGDEMWLEFNGSFGDRQCHFRRFTSSGPSTSASTSTLDVVRQLVGEWRADAGSACTSSPWRFRQEGGDLVWERTIRGAWEEYVRRPPVVRNGNHIEFAPRQGNAFELVGDDMWLEFNGSFGDRQCHFRRYR